MSTGSNFGDTDQHALQVEDDSKEFREFCESSSRLRNNPGNDTVSFEICVERSEFDMDNLLLIFSIGLILSLGVIVRESLSRLELNVPYTVIMMLLGLVAGQISSQTCPIFTKYVEIGNIKPHVILQTFLPVLIFESGFSINVHTFRRCLPQILLLAGPGMLLSTFITAALCIPIFVEYKWSFLDGSLLFASIISATDPVAVVAVLRDLGASESLSTLIEGESLLNDGIAVLLFKIFEELLVHESDFGISTIILESFMKFLRIGVGGPIFGYFMAKVTVCFLSQVYNDTIVEISITLASAYLTYFIGEELFGVSGILAVVVLALTVKAQHTCISPLSEQPLKNFWEGLGYMANTLLFFMIGLIIGGRAFDRIQFMDFPYLFILYAVITAVRFLLLLMLQPLMNRIGYGFDWRNLIVTGWGGLRGAVGLCLALEIYEEPNLCDRENLGSKILFQTAGIVLITLTVNATTTKKIMELLKMTGVSEGKKFDVENAIKKLETSRQRFLNGMMFHQKHYDTDWDTIYKISSIKSPYEKSKKLTKKLSLGAKMKLIFGEKMFNEALHKPNGVHFTLLEPEDNIDNESVLRDSVQVNKSQLSATQKKNLDEETRIRILKALKTSFHRQFEQGIVQGDALKFLTEACNRIEDVPSKMLTSVDVLKGLLMKQKPIQNCCLSSTKLMKIFKTPEENAYLSYEVGKCFVSGVDNVVAILPQLCHESKINDVAKIKRILEQEKQDVIRKLVGLQANYLATAIAAKTKHASRSVLNEMRVTLEELSLDGLLEREEQETLKNALEKLTKELRRIPKSIEPSSPLIFLNNLDWFKDFSPNIAQFVKSKVILLNFTKGEVIFSLGDPPEGIYLIVSGLLKIHFEPSDRINLALDMFGMLPVCEVLHDIDFKDSVTDLIGPGGVIGEVGYLKEECRASSVICETQATLYYFPSSLLREIEKMVENDFFLRLWTSWGIKVGAALLQRLPNLQGWSSERIQGYLERGTIPVINEQSVFEIPEFVADSIVIEGHFQDYDTRELFVAPCLIPIQCTRLLSKRNPMTVNRLLVISHEDVSKDVQETYFRKASNVSFISKTLGDLEPDFLEKVAKKKMVTSGRRMTLRQRRQSLAITSAKPDKTKKAAIKHDEIP